MRASSSDENSAPPAPRPPRRWPFNLDPARVRFWGVVVPIHVGAFATLYFGTYGLLERGYSQAGATAARQQLEQAVRAMPFLMPSQAGSRNPHIFGHLLAAHEPIGLRLYSAEAAPLGARNISPDRAEIAHVREFLRSSSRDDVWVEEDGGRSWVRGIVRLRAETACSPCHVPGITLGAATMKLDYTDELTEIRHALRWRVGLLLAAWVTLVGGLAVLVQYTVRRSVRRLEADLQAATAGQAADEPPRLELPLDPAAAELHRSLRSFLARQHEREQQVASRLAHVDQLATLGQLAAGLAHEIKNPLAGIQGALEVLKDESPEESTVRLYGEMLDELRRVNGILQRLLESGRPAPLRLARTDLEHLLGETADLLRPALRRRRVELAVETAAGLPAVQIDPAKIRQVLVNLIQNAGEAMPEEGGRIVVRASAFTASSAGGDGESAERGVVVAVADNGPGIAAEDLKRLFEPFYTTKFTGTGLGLAISKSLIEQHGGHIEVDSEPGRGTTFFLFLPERAAEPGAAPEARES